MSLADMVIFTRDLCREEIVVKDIEEMYEEEQEYIEDAYRYDMLKEILIEYGCPLKIGCHIPSVVSKWLEFLGARSNQT